ncbi:hypothetical protein [Arsukibacterium sp. MJ3]|uniref:hypothetical protein n=1 Tax=Arsukibacterium sp. MJ3 TaxID=1632859 RepID=UPI001910C738|nr:hypothetical protein [Arsukibacterium sp. MJ3]
MSLYQSVAGIWLVISFTSGHSPLNETLLLQMALGMLALLRISEVLLCLIYLLSN